MLLRLALFAGALLWRRDKEGAARRGVPVDGPTRKPEECCRDDGRLETTPTSQDILTTISALRAAMSLYRLRHQRGDDNEARQTLSDLYASFAEGLSTADLVAAQNPPHLTCQRARGPGGLEEARPHALRPGR